MSTCKLRASALVLCTIVVACGPDGGDDVGDARTRGSAHTPASSQRAGEPPLLAASASHACTLRATGLYCWGQNFSGQLGTGDLVDSEAAVAAKGAATDIVQLVASTGRTCVRRGAGKVACWGANDVGQRGDGTRDQPLTATEAVGVHDAVDLAIDDQTTCVVRGATRVVACWGGSLDDADPDTLRIVPIAGASDVIELRAGVNGEYCGRTRDHTVRCWSLEERGWTAAVAVPALAGARSIAMAAFDEVCGIVGAGPGPVRCHNLVNGVTVPLDDSADSVRVTGSGALSACAVDTKGHWHCWNVLPPMLELVGSPRIDAPTDRRFADFVLAGFHLCVLYPDDAVSCGEVDGLSLPKLVPVQGLPG